MLWFEEGKGVEPREFQLSYFIPHKRELPPRWLSDTDRLQVGARAHCS